MISIFSGRKALSSSAWPKSAIVDALGVRYDGLEHLGDDEGFALYQATDGKLNFVVALVEVNGAPDQIAEIGFLARFVGFNATQSASEFINRNAHIATSGLASGGDLYLIAGVQAAGRFDAASFTLILEAWKRDLMLAIHALSGGQAAPAHPIAGLEKARLSAVNTAPQRDGAPARGGRPLMDAFSYFFGDDRRMAVCTECDGRGKRGLVARKCAACEGEGLVKMTRGRR
ncbi:MAG: hypothetical protein AAFY22_10650 [Pseudomonadota bacterium]